MVKEQLLVNVLQALRCNSRESGASLARRIGLATSTSYGIIKLLKKRYIKRHVSLLNYKKIGIPYHSFIYGEHTRSIKNTKYLKKMQFINNAYGLQGKEFVLEILFRSLKEKEETIEQLKKRGCIIKATYDVIKQPMIEGWIPNKIVN